MFHHDSRDQRGETTPNRIARHDGVRVFKPEELRLVLLKLIAERPRDPAELIQAIADKRGGHPAWGAGALLPTLAMLRDLGFVTVTTGDDGIQRHAVTTRGTVVLDGNRATVDRIFARMRSMRRDAVAPQILRPMEALTRALRERLSESEIDLDGIRAMTAAIEAATATVARV